MFYCSRLGSYQLSLAPCASTNRALKINCNDQEKKRKEKRVSSREVNSCGQTGDRGERGRARKVRRQARASRKKTAHNGTSNLPCILFPVSQFHYIPPPPPSSGMSWTWTHGATVFHESISLCSRRLGTTTHHRP